jgi:hypothetical protein
MNHHEMRLDSDAARRARGSAVPGRRGRLIMVPSPKNPTASGTNTEVGKLTSCASTMCITSPFGQAATGVTG